MCITFILIHFFQKSIAQIYAETKWNFQDFTNSNYSWEYGINFYSVPSVALYVNIGKYAKQWKKTGSRIGPCWQNGGWIHIEPFIGFGFSTGRAGTSRFGINGFGIDGTIAQLSWISNPIRIIDINKILCIATWYWLIAINLST